MDGVLPADWSFQEVLELLRHFYITGYDFQQIASKMKEKNEAFRRHRNFYTSQLCQSVLQEYLKSTKDKPMVKEYFGSVPYNERMHAKQMFKYFENYNQKMQVFLKKLLTNDKYKNLLLEYKKGNITDSGDELTMITRNIPGLIKMALTPGDFQRSLDTQNVCEKLLVNKNVESFAHLEELLKEKLEDLEKQEKIKAENRSVSPVIVKLSQTPREASTPSTSKSVKQNEPKNVTPASSDTQPKRHRNKPSLVKEESKTISPVTETPTVKRKRPSTSSQKLSDIKLSSSVQLDPVVIPKQKPATPKGRLSLGGRGNKQVKSSNVEVQCQTYLSLTTKLADSDSETLLPSFEIKVESSSVDSKRTVSCQTGPVHFSDSDPNIVWWIDTDDKPHISASKLAAESIRSYDDCVPKETCLITMKTKKDNVLMDPFSIKLRENFLYQLLSEIRKADPGAYFYFPVKNEVDNYLDFVNHPMDIVAAEDLIIQDKVKDVIDLECCVALIAANAVYFDRIPKEAEDFNTAAYDQVFDKHLEQSQQG